MVSREMVGEGYKNAPNKLCIMRRVKWNRLRENRLVSITGIGDLTVRSGC